MHPDKWTCLIWRRSTYKVPSNANSCMHMVILSMFFISVCRNFALWRDKYGMAPAAGAFGTAPPLIQAKAWAFLGFHRAESAFAPIEDGLLLFSRCCLFGHDKAAWKEHPGKETVVNPVWSFEMFWVSAELRTLNDIQHCSRWHQCYHFPENAGAKLQPRFCFPFSTAAALHLSHTGMGMKTTPTNIPWAKTKAIHV